MRKFDGRFKASFPRVLEFPDYQHELIPKRHDKIYPDQVDNVVSRLSWDINRQLVEDVDYNFDWPYVNRARFVPRVLPVDYTPINTEFDGEDA